MNPITIEHRWRPIEDYEQGPATLQKMELEQLADIWHEQRGTLEYQQRLPAFTKRLHREWAIETGLLERIYTLDRGVTEVLIERGLDASLIPHDRTGQDPERVVAVLRDHEEAIDFLFDVVKGVRPLTTGFIKELHALFTRNQDSTVAVDTLGNRLDVALLKGDYKKLPNNPSRPDGVVHEYCPPEHVAAEMERLLQMHLAHVDVTPEVEAAWVHHRFTQIHPFEDGNGRVARSLATLVLIKAGWFPLVIRDVTEERTRYLDALEQADRGDLGPLVASFSASLRRGFVQALALSGEVQRHARAEQVIAATRDQLAARKAARRREWEAAKTTAARLQQDARSRLRELAQTLAAQTREYYPRARFFADAGGAADNRGHFFKSQIIQTAKALGYFANLAEYRAWDRLVLETDSRAEILISFHGTGHEYRGILAVSACFFRRDQTEQGEREIAHVTPLSPEIFQVNYKEQPDGAAERFKDWLEEAIVKGLESWRKGL